MPPVFNPDQPYTDETPKFDASKPYEDVTPRFDVSKPYDQEGVKKMTPDEASEALQSLSMVPFGMKAVQAQRNQELVERGGIVLKSDDEIIADKVQKAQLTNDEMEALGLPKILAPIERGLVAGAGGLTHPENVLFAAIPGGAAKPIFNTLMAAQVGSAAIQSATKLAQGDTEGALEKAAEAVPAAGFLAMGARSGAPSARDFKLTNKFSKKELAAGIEQQILNDLTMHGAPETAKVMEAIAPEAPKPAEMSSILDVGGTEGFLPERMSGVYQPAIKLKDGAIVKGADHGQIIKNAGLSGEQAGSVQRGYVDKTGKFMSMLDVARENMKKNEDKPAAETPTFKPDEPFTEVAPVSEKPPISPEGETAPTPETQPELIGMGGAIPAEFDLSRETPTSIKNAAVDRERELRGLPPAVEPIRRSFGKVWDEAMAKIDQDPMAQEDLINELREKPRALTDTEDAMLLQRQVDLQNEYGKATRDLAQAFDDGRMDAVESLKGRVDRVRDQLFDLYEIGKKSGTETGRGLNARKMMAYEDFTLAEMEVQKRAANGGRPLTPEQEAQVVEHQKKIEQTQREYEEYLADTERRLSEQAANEAHDRIVKDVKSEQAISPHIFKVAERIVAALDKRADAARARLKARLGATSAGVDPTILIDLAEIGAAHIGHIGLDFAKWSAKMVEDVGDFVKPHLEEVFTASQKQVDDFADKLSGKGNSPRVRRVVKKMDVAERQKVTTEAIKEKLTGGDKDISALVQRLARGFVEQGVKERNALIDAVHGVLKTIEPEITRRETMDAISGYGDFKPLTKDAISVQLRDLKGQMQQVAKLEDMQAGKAPSKSGVERRTPSDEERRLIAQVNEAKRKGGFTVTDPAQQLKSALEAVKTRLKHQISDLSHQIATKTRIVKEKTPLPLDAEAVKLREQRDALKADYEKIFGSREMTDAQKLKLATASVERSIAEYERRIKEKDFSKRESTGPTSPELEAIKARRDALREEYHGLKDLAEGKTKKTPEEISMQAYKTRLKNQTAELQDKLARGDFSKTERRTVDISKDMEAMRRKADYEKAKKDWLRGLELDRLKNRTPGQKAWDYTKEAFNLPRNILSSWDLSAVLRQGGFIGFGNPVRSAKAMKAMFQGLASERNAHALEQQILSRPNAPLYARSKLYLPALDEIRLSKREEALMSTLADKIPGVKQSNRAFLVFLNKLRADSFDTMVENLAKDGKKPTNEEINAISNYINIATGRGDLGKATPAAETLATFFFSPRLLASRFQLMAGQPLYQGTMRTRKLIATEYAKTLMGLMAVYGLGALAGGDLETDPRSTDFGKIKFGNTRVDPLMGLSQNTVLVTRLASGEKKTGGGKIQRIRDGKYGESSGAEILGQYLRAKLNPVMGTVVDVVAGKNVVGEKVTPVSAAANLTIPLSFRDIYDVMLEHGVPAGAALEMLSIFGMGIQHYEEKKKKVQHAKTEPETK